LLGGFLAGARATGLPLRILEIGASAGLNLRWDRYRYESADGAWGNAASPVVFTHSYEAPPPMSTVADVEERRGCDLHPVDPTSGEGALALRAFVWADQLSRLATLDGALEVARSVPADVEKADAVTFLEEQLRSPFAGVATVVYHSVFLPYVSEADVHRIADVIQSAQARATEQSPVFRLAMEAGAKTYEVRLDGRLLATCGAHGTGVRWVEPR
jgi:hypothetical protein